jgi:hypothetical protein
VKRPAYRRAIEWVAFNDGAGDPDALDPEVVSGLTTVVLLADLFEVEAEKVGRDVVRFRKAHVNE